MDNEIIAEQVMNSVNLTEELKQNLTKTMVDTALLDERIDSLEDIQETFDENLGTLQVIYKYFHNKPTRSLFMSQNGFSRDCSAVLKCCHTYVKSRIQKRVSKWGTI